MEKGFLLGIVGALVATAATVIACSSDNDTDSQFQQPDAPDGGTIDNPLLPEGGGGEAGEAGGGPQCQTPTIPADFAATWKAPTKNASACTSAQIDAYYDACLKDLNDKATCETFRTNAANTTCVSCAEATDASGPIQFRSINSSERAYYTLNIAGCIAAQQAPDGQDDQGCGAKYNAAIQCRRDSCQQCLQTGGTFGNFTYCQNLVAKQGLCASLASAYGTACPGTSTTEPTSECFPKQSGAEDQKVYTARVIALTCGTPVDADAGP